MIDTFAVSDTQLPEGQPQGPYQGQAKGQPEGETVGSQQKEEAGQAKEVPLSLRHAVAASLLLIRE